MSQMFFIRYTKIIELQCHVSRSKINSISNIALHGHHSVENSAENNAENNAENSAENNTENSAEIKPRIKTILYEIVNEC